MKRVLLIDDEELLLVINSKILKRHGYHVLFRNTAIGILDIVRQFLPDIIVMDHMMPEVSGADAVTTLKAHNQYCNIPVVLFSATKDIAQTAKTCGADSWLIKCGDLDALPNKLKMMLAGT